MSVDLNAPQPDPKESPCAPVWPAVVDFVRAHTVLPDDAVSALLVADMVARNEAGIAKYGVPLRAHDGRDHLVDAYQESLDLTVYLRAHCEEAGPDAQEGAWSDFEDALILAHRIRSRIAARSGELVPVGTSG